MDDGSSERKGSVSETGMRCEAARGRKMSMEMMLRRCGTMDRPHHNAAEIDEDATQIFRRKLIVGRLRTHPDVLRFPLKLVCSKGVRVQAQNDSIDFKAGKCLTFC